MARDCLAAACEAGVNFFDNAEAYAGGESERIMGEAIAELGWARATLRHLDEGLLGPHTSGVNMQNTLNRKYLMQAIDGSLERFGLDFVDLLFCHRPDPNTPIEETVWAMSRHHRRRARRSTGARRSGRPTRSAPRGTSPTATTCTSR